MCLYPPTPPPPLPSPNNLSATFANSSSNSVSVQLNWSPVPGATQYIINYSTHQTFGSNNTYLGTITQSSFLAQNLPLYNSYTFLVTANNGSVLSSPASVTLTR